MRQEVFEQLFDMNQPQNLPSKSLNRDAWIRAAIDLLAKEGIAGLRVERLAHRLGVTKGSFYWHFKDRRDLHLAVLEHWKAGRIADIDKQTRCPSGTEAEQLLHVIDVYSASRNPRGILIELAVREWARRDEAAAAVVSEVDAVRLDRARRLFLACGLDEATATARAALLYAYVYGMSLLLLPVASHELEAMRRQIAQWIAACPSRTA
ncbi:transcriptional regulator, TetR family [Hydrogenophilus thermoluteolus]|uniref:Transcriptional regulator, TetR family n=2 Tax=Hydrogenophilus thermoluteolus TaxID=297 RepID=A0A2Z6DXW3_HYDTE|nr:transcriptional regulator, TetR family [Hydrogenophilus thermoluteolus]